MPPSAIGPPRKGSTVSSAVTVVATPWIAGERLRSGLAHILARQRTRGAAAAKLAQRRRGSSLQTTAGCQERPASLEASQLTLPSTGANGVGRKRASVTAPV